MPSPTFSERFSGCLLGAAIGAELGYSGLQQRVSLKIKHPLDLLTIDPQPVSDPPIPHNQSNLKTTAFVDLGMRAYITAAGRVTPEVFGALLRDDPGIAQQVFAWDAFHSVQEILKEGMHPRISGLGVAPNGMLCASMPAVGLFHAGDPEYAYLDGVELASVAQPRLGADWAALCAAAVAAALAPGATAAGVMDTVLKIAHRNNPDLFYLINPNVRHAQWMSNASEEDFIGWWLAAGRRPQNKEGRWIEYNPLFFVLPLLERYAEEPRKLLRIGVE